MPVRWAAGIVTVVVLGALVAPGAPVGIAAASTGAWVGRAKEPAYEETVRLTVDDLQDYWANELPTLYGVRYRKIPASKIIAYTSTSKIPRCGPGRVSYKDVAENAFYCNAGKFVAYDDENLFPQLDEQFGDFTIALTLAHEWGHAVQDQAGLTGPTIALEQQADCFAGAWVRNVGDGASNRLSLNEGNLDTGLAGFLTFRDPPGSDPTAEGAHGSAFDRVGAFQEGYDNGPERCADFENNPPELTDIQFTDPGDADRGGDLPFRQVVPVAAEDLDAYWSGLLTDYQSVEHITPYDPKRALPVCDGQQLPRSQAVNGIAYCGENRTIAYDRQLLPDVYERSGDFGVAVVIAAEWAVAMQQDQAVTGEPRSLELQQSCFTGSWAGDVVRGGHNPDGQGLTLSAGDLDEAIQSFLIFRDTDKISAGTGATAFENADAFRSGFFQGEQFCVDLVPAS
ncbi:MAG TPA: neutral zinc metallopeptidase [Acidimicrobiia bacterium]